MDEKTVIQSRSEGIRPGVRLNGVYEIESLIAQGGMGEVYKGFNVQTRDPVAIKMIRAEMSEDEDVIALFRREASTLFNLHHEAIVRYFVFSVDPTLQRAYLAMEFVGGPSLAKRIGERPLTPEEARILVARIGGALDAAHRVGVVHRDISSDNFILPDGDVRRAKLIDFGIARSLLSKEATIIGEGFAGKYNYVSPEQLGLAGGVVTAKSDIYSFGLVLAEALGGRPLNMSGTTLEILDKRRRVPDLAAAPAEFRAVLQWMLQPNPNDRPATMAAVVAKLESSAKSKNANSGGGRGRLAAIVAALLIVASLAGAGFVFRNELAETVAELTQPPAVQKVQRPPLGTPGTDTPGLEKPTDTLPPPPEKIVAPPPVEVTPTSPPPGDKQTKPVTAEILLDAAPPAPPSANVALPGATVGKQYSASIPAFRDPGGKGLILEARDLPEGLALHDRGDGSAEISGIPTRAGPATVTIIATNHTGRTGQMIANFVVAGPPRPPHPAQATVTLAPAVAGRDYNAALPPFSPGGDLRGLKLRAEPEPPAGLVFADAGAGFSMLAGRATQPGAYSFEVIPSDANGVGSGMTVKLTVIPDAARPRPPTPPATTVPTGTAEKPAPTGDVAQKVSAFLKSYGGGACFFAQQRPGAQEPYDIDAVASERAAFDRFETAFLRGLGVEPAIAGVSIAAAQCPLIDLLRLTADGGKPPAKIALDGAAIDSSHPLSGHVSGLSGRRLQLVLIDNDGGAYLLESTPDANGDGASFHIQLSGDAQSIGKLQTLVAVASDNSPSVFSGARATTATTLTRDLASEWSKVGATASAAYFWFAR